MFSFYKIKAFTLAETLITLVIIGVVAAITIPILHNNYVEQERVSRVKKVYSTLGQAMLWVKSEGGSYDFETADGNDALLKKWYQTYLEPRLVTTKICYATTKGCWNEGDSYFLNGSVASYNRTGVGIGNNIITAVLVDGALINIDGFSAADMRNTFGVNVSGNSGFVLYFDINGSKKPNTIGKDIFVTVFAENGFAPAFRDKTSAQIESDCSKSGKGVSCIMKYLRK